jgi:lipoyl(octanoyl) transferase
VTRPLEVIDWGVLDYATARDRQLVRVDERKVDACNDALIFVEHPHVITLGRRRESPANVLNPGDVPVIEIERGGDVTYHGPGQLVAYPILKLEEGERDLHLFLRNLEEAIILCLRDFSIEAGREDGKTGVWREGRKLASIGISCRRWVTFHGLALNVSTDLSYFSRINPCGFDAQVMTNMVRESESDAEISFSKVKHSLGRKLAQTLTRTLI